MKKRIPLYDLISKLDSKEKIFVRKYILENLSTSSKKNYLDFYNILLKTNELSDNYVLRKLSKNKLKNYLPEAKFYLKKIIVKTLRIHYAIKHQKNKDDFLSNIEKQKEIYIYFSKGLYEDARLLCDKYAKEWELSGNFAMLSFAYKKLHQIEVLTSKNKVSENKYYELYTALNNFNFIKSKYYNLSLKVEKDLFTKTSVRTYNDIKRFQNYLSSEIMTAQKSEDIYFWYVQILCNFALLNFKALSYCFAQIEQQIVSAEIKETELLNRLQLFGRLTFISIEIDNNSSYYLFKNEYLQLIADITFLTNKHKNMFQLNAKIMESLFLFKQNKYKEMLSIIIPKLDIENYIFEGTIKLNYVDLLFARGKAYFKLLSLNNAYDYFNFIIENKKKLKAKAFIICNAFFHIWLIQYILKEYKILPSISNRYKIFLSIQKIDYPLEKALLKFMYSISNNYSTKNTLEKSNILLETLEELSLKLIDEHLIKKLDIITYLEELRYKLV